MLRPSCKRVVGFAQSRVVVTRRYHERVVEHFYNPRNVGSFDKNDPNVGTGLVGSPACGDVLKLQIKVDPNTGQVVDSRQRPFGCGSAIASSPLGSKWVKEKQVEELLSIKNKDKSPVKLHRSMLAEDAIKAALKDYEAKRRKLKGTSPEYSPSEKA